MSKRSKWKGTEPVARSAKQRKLQQEWEEKSPEERRAATRKQLIGFLEMAQGNGPIMYIDGMPQTHNPMSKEEAALHLSLFVGEVEPTTEVQLQLAHFELTRFPKSQRALGKVWKLSEKLKEEEEE